MKVRFLRLSRVRISALFLFIAFFLYQNSIFAEDKRLENTLLAQEITLIEAIHHISEQYQVLFNYDRKIVSDIKVQYEPEQFENVDAAIASILKETNLKYQIFSHRYVVIYKNDEEGIESLKEMIQHFQTIVDDREDIVLERQRLRPSPKLIRTLPQDILGDRTITFSIEGTVTDQDGEPLIGVNIQVKGTNKGTATDFEGNFTLEDIDENAVLVVSYIGYQTQEVPVAGKSNLSIVLISDSQLLDEVVVVGYGTQKKINLSGAVDVITGEELQERQSPTVSQLLQGVSPSLDFSIGNNYGFQPGATMDINIRGVGSLNGGEPYVLIDGTPGNLNLLNPADIESISILKDAAASAIYGARAPYGVILITTKKGALSEKINVKFNANLLVNIPMILPEMPNSIQFAKVLNEAGRNSGSMPFSTQTIDRMVAFQNNDYNFLRNSMDDWPEEASNFGAYPDGNIWNNSQLNYANTDWWDIYFGSSISHNENLSISGGTDRSSYYLSFGHLNQNSVLQYGTDYYKRTNLMGKLDFNIVPWWNLSYEPRFSINTRERPNMTQNEVGDYDHMFRHLLRAYPNTPIYNGWGSPEEGGDFMSESHIPSILSGTDKDDYTDVWNIFRTKIDILNGLSVNADFSYNSYTSKLIQVDKTALIQQVDKSYAPLGTTIPNQYEQTNLNINYWTANVFANSNFKIGTKNDFGLLLGMQFEKGNDNMLSGYKTDLIFQDIPSIATATGNALLRQTLNHSATEGYFLRLNYNYDEKYIFEVNGRYDGSYVFRAGKRWGFFPSFSTAWNLHREKFWNISESIISFLKLRGSWGQLGNQNILPYSDLEIIPINPNRLDWIFTTNQSRKIGYTQAPEIVNYNLTWETATTSNLGINLGILNNKLLLDFDVFQRTTSNMVGPSEAVPGVLGAGVPRSNNSELKTTGWELGIKWRDNIKPIGVSYNVSLNIYDNTSKVVAYTNPTGTLSTWYEGQVIGEIWGYTVNDLIRSKHELDSYVSEMDLSFIATNWNTGDLKYEDINGDNKISNGSNTKNDHGDLKIIGNNSPRYQFGVSLNLSYKNLDFSSIIRGVGKRDYYFNENAVFYWQIMRAYWDTNIDAKGDRLDYFRDTPGDEYAGLYVGEKNINTDAFWPRPYLDSSGDRKNRGHANTRYLANAAYLRLQNIQIGYTFPTSITSKFKLQEFRIYASGENLFTFDDLPKGIDPAVLRGFNGRAGAATYGADRIFTIGLSVIY